MAFVAFGLLAACSPTDRDKSTIIANAAPIIRAIEAYVSDVGDPPDDLSDLVPKYLAAIPSTGVDAYPAYSYVRREDNPKNWILSVHVPSIGLSLKNMSYSSSGRYPIPVTPIRDGWVMVDP
jgi:hypothetical protein